MGNYKWNDVKLNALRAKAANMTIKELAIAEEREYEAMRMIIAKHKIPYKKEDLKMISQIKRENQKKQDDPETAHYAFFESMKGKCYNGSQELRPETIL